MTSGDPVKLLRAMARILQDVSTLHDDGVQRVFAIAAEQLAGHADWLVEDAAEPCVGDRADAGGAPVVSPAAR